MYIQIERENIWQVYTTEIAKDGLPRGGGNTSGRVWLLPRDRKLPEGLVINYKTIDHPLLNVSRKMKMSELIGKLKEVEAMMTDSGVKI